jgi:single-strand DNA-binding protein
VFNKVILAGNLTKDVEVRYTQNGSAIAKTGIAVNRKFKINGEQKEEVLFIDLTFFGRSAEVANQYLKKGSKVLVEGRLILEQWTSQDGSKKSKHSIVVESMQMLDNQPYATENRVIKPQGGYSQPQQQQPMPTEIDENENIPF